MFGYISILVNIEAFSSIGKLLCYDCITSRDRRVDKRFLKQFIGNMLDGKNLFPRAEVAYTCCINEIEDGYFIMVI